MTKISFISVKVKFYLRFMVFYDYIKSTFQMLGPNEVKIIRKLILE